MKTYRFKNEQVIPISSGTPSKITSEIDVLDTGGSITDINIRLDVAHSWTNDLEIKLIGPSGTEVLLAGKLGGSGDNFEDTVFDDDAATSINGGSPPFRGIFSPEEALNTFHGSDANGTWKLEISDTAFQDGGSLNQWELEILTDEVETNTGPFIFHNRTPKGISAGAPNVVESQINITGLDNITVDTVCVTIDIDHTYANDLKISLISPLSREVLLVEREGGSGDNFKETTFDETAGESIIDGSPPFTGSFRPEGDLSHFKGIAPNGNWTLRVEDRANLDGGTLNSWSLAIKSNFGPDPERPFKIEVRFLGGLSASQRAIFDTAADRWAEVIVGNLPPVITDIGQVDDVVIDAESIPLDGTGGTLGQAGPTALRPGSLLPARGIMQFDTADIQKMESDGELLDVIIHEMGHVLGIGTIWPRLGLINGAGTNNPEFNGINAMTEYAVLRNNPNPLLVPLANTGGDGTREGHWRESVFDRELMTGYDDQGRNPMSRLTVASLQDLGYQVDLSKADSYILPFRLLSSSEVEAKPEHRCLLKVPDMVVLPEENMVS